MSGGARISGNDVKRVFDALDRNHNGELAALDSGAEGELSNVGVQGEPSKELHEALRYFDRNSDGRLSKAEAATVLNAMANSTELKTVLNRIRDDATDYDARDKLLALVHARAAKVEMANKDPLGCMDIDDPNCTTLIKPRVKTGVSARKP